MGAGRPHRAARRIPNILARGEMAVDLPVPGSRRILGSVPDFLANLPKVPSWGDIDPSVNQGRASMAVADPPLPRLGFRTPTCDFFQLFCDAGPSVRETATVSVCNRLAILRDGGC